MKQLLTILFILFCGHTFAQTASAGNDTTIYLTLGNTATLNGAASSATSYQWTEVSTDYMSGATITNATSKVATVSPLPQGVFYFQIAATTGGTTVVDTMKVTVNYASAPGTLMRSMAQTAWSNTEFIDTVNSRTSDTTNTLDQEVYHTISFPDGLSNQIFFDRDRKNDQYIDPQRGKFYSIIEDGYQWNGQGYNRSEMSFGTGYTFDTTKTYCMEWKGYFKFPFTNLTLNQTVAVFMQIHADSTAQNVYGTQINNDGTGTKFVIDSGGVLKTVCGVDSFVNKTHTVRVTFKEGNPGAFYKVEVDGVQKLYLAGTMGGLPKGKDYPKIATLYDYGNALVDPTNHTRGRKDSLVTEDFSIYDVSTATAAPTISMSGSQTITTNSTNITGTPTWASGHTGVVLWTLVSGSGTIATNNTNTTTVNGLGSGANAFKCTATQDDGQTVSGTVTVTYNPTVAAPTANAGGNQTITLPTNSITLTGSATSASGHTSTYLWTITSGSGTITNGTTLSPTISGLTGNVTVQLKVTQDDSQIATSSMTITVNAAPSGISQLIITHGAKKFYKNIP